MKKATLPQALDQHAKCIDEEEYATRLKAAQKRLLTIQQAYLLQKRRAVVVFEGDDAAGKGGAIHRLTGPLDPRFCKVWPIGAPTPEELGRHWLARFWEKLPTPGTIAVFDRSWYGRVLVERAESLIDKAHWKRAYDEIVDFERMLADDGVRLVKIYLAITPEEQAARFIERLREPVKRWKITRRDFEARGFARQYRHAVKAMLQRTHHADAPWRTIAGNFKWHARAEALEHVATRLADGIDLSPPAPDPVLMQLAEALLREPRKD